MSSSRQIPIFKTDKLRGEWAELCFMTRAAELGLMVSKPWGDSAAYDFMVENRGRCLRIQVKSTTYERKNSYFCHVVSKRIPYDKSALDFIAAYLIPVDIWYIIPIDAFGQQGHLGLMPNRKTSKYNCYKEAWHQLL